MHFLAKDKFKKKSNRWIGCGVLRKHSSTNAEKQSLISKGRLLIDNHATNQASVSNRSTTSPVSISSSSSTSYKMLSPVSTTTTTAVAATISTAKSYLGYSFDHKSACQRIKSSLAFTQSSYYSNPARKTKAFYQSGKGNDEIDYAAVRSWSTGKEAKNTNKIRSDFIELSFQICVSVV